MTSPLRILHVIPAVAPRYGGPSRVVTALCRALRAQGVDARIATTDADGEGRLDVPTSGVTEHDGIPTWFFERQVSEAFKYSRHLATWLDRHVSDFDVVHVHAVYSHSSIAASRACRRHGVPYVLRPLGTLDPWSVNRKALRKRALWHAGVGEMVRGAAAVHYTTAAEQLKAESIVGSTPGHVIGLGVDHEVFDLEPEAGDYVLFMSRLHEKKGLERLVEAFARATESAHCEWRLVIAGTGTPEYETTIRKVVRDQGLDDRVTFAGWVSGPRRLELLRGAGCFALTSHQENFGLAVAEAMAAAVPVLLSPGVDLSADVERAGAGVVTELDPGSIAAGLRRVLESDRAEMGMAGRTFARDAFAWDAIAASMLDLYVDLTSRDSGGGAASAVESVA